LPEDASAEWQVLLDGKRQNPTFTSRRALGLVAPAGVRELRVRHRAREFARPVVVRAGEHTPVTVTFPRLRLLLEFIEDVPAGLAVWINGARARPASRGRRSWEFEVEPGTHAVLVRAGGREFRNTVVVDRERTPPLTVDLGPARTPPAQAKRVASALSPANEKHEVCAYEPADVWRAGLRLRNRRIRVMGLGKVFAMLDDRVLIRFQGGNRPLLNCYLDADKCGSLKGAVRQGEYRVVTLEAEVQGSSEGVVALGNGRLIWAADRLND
jgi:hypothetical protein